MSTLHEKFNQLKEIILKSNPNPQFGAMMQAVNELESFIPAKIDNAEISTLNTIVNVEVYPTASFGEEPRTTETPTPSKKGAKKKSISTDETSTEEVSAQ